METTTFQLNSSFGANALYWICGLDAYEQGPTRRILEDLQGHSRLPIPVIRLDVDSPTELIAVLDKLHYNALHCSLRPIVHFDMHGSKSAGLKLGNSFLEWESLGQALRKLNVATGNKLLVVGGACHALSAIRSLNILSASPFFVLLAPEDEVQSGFIESHIVSFYSELFNTASLDRAFEQLGDPFQYIHCEKLLFIMLSRYIEKKLKGKTLQQRRERLLTEVFLANEKTNPETLKKVRLLLKSGLKPTQSLLDRYSGVFLCNRPCSFTIDDVLKLVR